MPALANIFSIYESAPWIFDGIIICTLLGVLFRILFEKGKIGEEKQAKKLGGIFGFFLGIAMVGYMQYRQWTLFIDGGPWVFGIIIFSLVAVLWAVVDGYLEKEKRSMTIPIALVVALGLIYGFLNVVPSYMAGVTDLFGDYVWLWHLIVWCLLIFILFWALLGLMAGGYGAAGTGVWGGLGTIATGLGKGLKGIGKGIGWAAPGAAKGIGSAAKAPFKAGWWGLKKGAGGAGWLARKTPLLKRLFKGKGVTTPEDTKTVSQITDKVIAGTQEEAEKVDEILNAAKKVNAALAKILNDIRASASGTQKNIQDYKPENYAKVSAWLKAKLEELKEGRADFEGIKLAGFILDQQENLKKAKAEIELALRNIANYTRIQELAAKIGMISDDNDQKPGIIEDAKAEAEHLKAIVTGLGEVIKQFEKAVDEVIKNNEVADVQKKIAEFGDKLTEVQTLLAPLAALIAGMENVPEEDKKAAEDTARQACAKLATAAALAIEQLGTFTTVTIEGKLKQGVSLLETTIKRFAEGKNSYLKDFTELQKSVDALLAKVEDILSKQATPEDKAALIAELSEVLDIIKNQRDALRLLITHAETFIRVLDEAFLSIIKEGEAELEGEMIVRRKGETKIRMKAKAAEVAIPSGEKEAREATLKAIAKAKELRETAAKELAAGEEIATTAIAQLRYAEGRLTTVISESAGINAEQKKNLEQLLRNLSAFLAEETDLKSLITMLGSHEKFILDTIMERVSRHIAGKRTTMTVSAAIKEMVGIINRLKKKLETLNVEIAYIEKEEKELTSESVPPPSGGFTSEIVPPPPPVTS